MTRRMPFAAVCFLALACAAAEPYIAPVAQRTNLFSREATRPALPAAPPSAWVATDRRTFEAVLGSARAEVLVAPVQVQGFGFDRSTRSLMQLHVVDAFRRSGMEPGNAFAIQRALGEGLRTIDLADLRKLASTLQASRIVALYAGYEEGPKLTANIKVNLQVHVLDRERGAWIAGAVTGYTAPLDEVRAVAETFEEKMLPAILKDLGVAAPALAAPPTTAWPAMPGKIGEAFAFAEAGGSSEAAMLQLFAMLAPPAPERARERLFEQSLFALRGLPADAPAARLMRARAWFYLNARSTALAALGKPRAPAEEAFESFLNGNFPDLSRHVARIDDKLQRLMAELELRDLQQSYRVPGSSKAPAYFQAFARERPQWAPLVMARIGDGDGWEIPENYRVRSILDELFPIDGFSLESDVRGRQAIGKMTDRVELGLGTFEHVRRVRTSSAFLASCALATRQCPRAAFLDLAEARAIRTEARALRHKGLTQGLPEEAQALAALAARELDGQPDFAAAHATVLQGKAKGRRLEERDRATLRTNAYAASYWDQGQSQSVLDATGALESVDSDLAARFLEQYYDDVPMRDYWLPSFYPDNVARLGQREKQLRATNDQVRPVIELARLLGPKESQDLAREVANRFRGSPERATLLDVIYLQTSKDADGRLKIVREALLERPDLWALYEKEGKLLMEEKGAPKEATAAYLRYPAFKDPGEYNAVGVGNNAYSAGTLLLRHGEYDGARKLFAVSAKLRTGSGAQMLSDMHLAALDERYAEALRSAFSNATRYETSGGYRAYLGYLFATGKADEAWAGFNHVHAGFRDPQVWGAAEVGTRMQGRSWKETREWLMRDPIRKSGGSTDSALAFALVQNVVDRVPAPDFVEAMKGIEGAPSVPIGPGPGFFAMVPLPGSGSMWEIEPSIFARQAPRPSGLADGAKVHSHYVLFAEGYAEFRAGRYAEAAERFFRLAQYFPIEGNKFYSSQAYALPYFAYASARSGDKYKAEPFLPWFATFVQDRARFEYLLAVALVKSAQGDNDGAVAGLDNAFRHRVHAHRMPISEEYQWVEACELLLASTGDGRYRELALKGARISQKVDPTWAWPYAVEAKLAPPSPARERALGFALYLDPGSEHLVGIAEADKAAARAAFESTNPFTRAAPRRDGRVAMR